METFTVTLRYHSTKKHSVRYDSDEQDAKVKSLYVSNTAFTEGQVRPDSITVTIRQV